MVKRRETVSFGTYPSPEMIGLQTLSMQQITDAISQFDRTALLRDLAECSLCLTNDGQMDKAAQHFVVKRVFPSTCYSKAMELIDNPEHRGAVYTGFIRDLIRIMMSCEPSGCKLVATDEDRALIASALLSATKATSPPFEVNDSDPVSYIKAFQLGNYNMQSIGRTPHRLVRMIDQIATIALKSLDGQDYKFERIVDNIASDLMPHIAMTAYFRQFSQKYLEAIGQAQADIVYIMALSGVDREHYRVFSDDSCLNFDAILPFPAESASMFKYKDYKEMAQRPYMILPGGNAICLDLDFAVQRMNSVLTDRLDDLLGAKQRMDCFGYAFEEYVVSLIECFRGARKNVRIGHSSKHCQIDGIWQEDSITVLIEAKSTIMRLDVRYGIDEEVVREHVDARVVGRQEGNAKTGPAVGVEQLIAKAEECLKNPSQFGLRRIKTLILVLLVQDRALAEPWLGAYISNRFRDLSRDRLPTKVLFCCIDILHFESLLITSKSASISDALFSLSKLLRDEVVFVDNFISLWQSGIDDEVELPVLNTSVLSIISDRILHLSIDSRGARCLWCNTGCVPIRVGAEPWWYCGKCSRVIQFGADDPRFDEYANKLKLAMERLSID